MVKVHTMKMIEHFGDSIPNVTAHADMINGALVGLTYTGTSKVTKAPTTGEKLYVVMNTQEGDKEYALTYPIAQGEFVNLFDLADWVGMELDVTKENITGTFADIAVGDTLTFDATTFKFKEDTATTGDICFTVIELLTVGVRVLVTVAA